MLSHRFLNIRIIVAILAMIELTFREVTATAVVISWTNSIETACKSLPSRYSIHTEYVEKMSTWMIYTEDESTGVDGGLIYLRSNYRNCSR